MDSRTGIVVIWRYPLKTILGVIMILPFILQYRGAAFAAGSFKAFPDAAGDGAGVP